MRFLLSFLFFKPFPFFIAFWEVNSRFLGKGIFRNSQESRSFVSAVRLFFSSYWSPFRLNLPIVWRSMTQFALWLFPSFALEHNFSRNWLAICANSWSYFLEMPSELHIILRYYLGKTQMWIFSTQCIYAMVVQSHLFLFQFANTIEVG